MGTDDAGAAWLGMVPEGGGATRWRLPVTDGVASGASALFGGCATAAALVAARQVSAQPLVWAGAHFGSLAKLGSEVVLDVRTISAGRTMTHVEVVGRVEGEDRESFVVRVAAGERPAHPGAGQWLHDPLDGRASAGPDGLEPFAHPVHERTWAARFEWRLAGRGTDPAHPWSAWWVRPNPGEPDDLVVSAAVLCDYVTYGIGRAIGVPMGGLSIDNVLRLHRPAAAAGTDGWLLLVVRPDAIEGGFGHGTASLSAGGQLMAIGSQSVVLNNWDWRLPSEAGGAGSAASR